METGAQPVAADSPQVELPSRVRRARARGQQAEGNLRERLFEVGCPALTDPELLSVLLGIESSRRAEDLLERAGGLKSLFLHEPPELFRLKGMTRSGAARLLAALELGRRLQASGEARPRLSTPSELYRYLRPRLGLQRREQFHVLCFNSRNVLLRDAQVASGTMNACPVDPREVFGAALTARATAIALAHNHPSGDPEPSLLDLALTRQLAAGARLLGLRLLDHLIVGDGAFTSLRQRGQLEGDAAEHRSASDRVGWGRTRAAATASDR